MATYERLVATAPELYAKNVAHYRALQERTVGISTPDPRVDTAFAWAKVGIDKGMAEQPAARHRAAGRLPDVRGKRAARVRVDVRARRAVDRARHHVRRRLRRHAHGLDFLRRFQRADGKIPHEISQSASLVPLVGRLRVPVGVRRRDPAVRDRARRSLERDRRPRVPRRVVGVDREGLAVLVGDRP